MFHVCCGNIRSSRITIQNLSIFKKNSEWKKAENSQFYICFIYVNIKDSFPRFQVKKNLVFPFLSRSTCFLVSQLENKYYVDLPMPNFLTALRTWNKVIVLQNRDFIVLHSQTNIFSIFSRNKQNLFKNHFLHLQVLSMMYLDIHYGVILLRLSLIVTDVIGC